MNITLINRTLQILILVLLVVILYACAMTEPLATQSLQKQAQEHQASVVIINFRSLIDNDRSSGENLHFNLNHRCQPRWAFAAANESTGWNFRELDYESMVFRTRKGTFEADSSNIDSGWITLVVPPGMTYFAVLTPREFSKISSLYGDCISSLDFIDAQRFMLHVSNKQSFLYGGSIVDEGNCVKSGKASECTTVLSVFDESDSAHSFVARYSKSLTINRTLQTQLLSIPQSRTIEIP